jgi:hypothetical protein
MKKEKLSQRLSATAPCSPHLLHYPTHAKALCTIPAHAAPDAYEPTTTSTGESSALSALEIAVAKMIARDKDNSFHSALTPGTAL